MRNSAKVVDKPLPGAKMLPPVLAGCGSAAPNWKMLELAVLCPLVLAPEVPALAAPSNMLGGDVAPPVLGAPNMKMPPELGASATALAPPEFPKMLPELLLLLLGATSKMLAAGFPSPSEVAGLAAAKRPSESIPETQTNHQKAIADTEVTACMHACMHASAQVPLKETVGSISRVFASVVELGFA